MLLAFMRAFNDAGPVSCKLLENLQRRGALLLVSVVFRQEYASRFAEEGIFTRK